MLTSTLFKNINNMHNIRWIWSTNAKDIATNYFVLLPTHIRLVSNKAKIIDAGLTDDMRVPGVYLIENVNPNSFSSI